MGPLSDGGAQEIPRVLRDLGFHVVKQTPGEVVLESDKLRITFEPGRGPMAARMSSRADPDRHWNVQQVLEAIRDEHSSQSPELSEFAAAVRTQYPALAHSLAPRMLETLLRVQESRAPGQTSSSASASSGSEALLNGMPLGSQRVEKRRRPLLHVLIWIALLALVYLLLRR